MDIKWYSTCFMCRSPLDFAVIISDDKLASLCTYARFKPINFMKNISYKKIIGLNQRKVCFRCFMCKYEGLPGPAQIATREHTGRKMVFGEPYRVPMSEKEVYTWFEDFYKFSERPDVEEYIMKNEKFNIKGLVMICWSHSLQDLQEILNL